MQATLGCGQPAVIALYISALEHDLRFHFHERFMFSSHTAFRRTKLDP